MLPLSAESKKFIDENIQNVEDLEILFLLRSDERREWDATEVSKQLGMEPISASNHLMRLHLKGLIDHEKNSGRLFHYRYSKLPKSRDRRIEELQEVFARDRMEVVNYIVTRQRRQLQAFADAFQGKRDPKDG